MHMQIKNRFSPHVIFEGDYNSVRDAVEAAIKQNVSLQYADLRGADLRGADLRGAELQYADLCGADLRGADLRNAELAHVSLRGADLRGADLRGAELWYADLRGADLSGADLRDADLWRADLSGANLQNANSRGVELGGVRLQGANLKNVVLFDEKLKIAPRQMDEYGYGILIAGTKMKIGCELHSIQEWRDFKDEQIKKMDDGALDWWTEHKPLIMPIALKHLENHNKMGE